MKRMSQKKGFTLVELVIVIAVIAILAGVMIASFSGVVSDARKSATIQDAKTLLDTAYIDFITANPGEVPCSVQVGYSSDGKKIVDIQFSENAGESGYIPLSGTGEIVILDFDDEKLVLTWNDNGYTLETKMTVTGTRPANS